MVTIDANVWIAAADKYDAFHLRSRNFLSEVLRQQIHIYLPAFAQVEVACAIARRKQSAAVGKRLADNLQASTYIVHVPMDAQLLAHALQVGTRHFLRAGDALYLAVAEHKATTLISWDDELIQRASAMTPSDWLAANT